MTAANFNTIMAHEFAFEGGYVDHPKDPGGATNMGITIGALSDFLGRPASKAEVKALTKAQAAEIFRGRYWNHIRGDDLPGGVDLMTMDGAVNSGVSRGVRWLQSAIGVAQDGRAGPQTIATARAANAPQTVRKMAKARMSFLQGLRTWNTFGRGWSVRVAKTEALALKLAGVSAPALAEAAAKARADAKTKATGAAGAGGGSVVGSTADLSQWAVYGLLGVAALVVVYLVWKSLHDKDRAAALAQVAGGEK